MMAAKIKKWLQGDAVLDVASWLINTYSALKKTVDSEAPGVSDTFFAKLPSIYELTQLDTAALHASLPAAFDLLPDDVAYKLEMRYRSYANRRIKKDPRHISQPVATKKSWCSPAQAHEILDYLYEKLPTIRSRDGLFIDPDNAVAFDMEIIKLKAKNIADQDVLQVELESALKHHLNLTAWRELKHTIRSYRHTKANKLVSIKVDENAKVRLEKFKNINNLNSLSDAIALLCERAT